MHYYQFNLGDYAAKTQHLDDIEDLAYRRMIDLYMRLESPLPNDDKEIARLIRMRSHTESISNVLRDFFKLTDNGYVDQSLQDIVDKYKEKSYKAKKSAEARWKKESPADRKNTDANALETQCKGDANQEPITINQEPLNNKQSKRFKKPTLQQVTEYIKEKNYLVDPESFIDKNESIGWVVGKTSKPMKCWKSTIKTWDKFARENQAKSNNRTSRRSRKPMES